MQERITVSQSTSEDGADDLSVWCKCGNCPAMERRVERVCCMDEAKWQEQYNKTGSATVNMTMKIILVTIIFVLGIVGYLLDCNNFKNIFNKDAHM